MSDAIFKVKSGHVHKIVSHGLSTVCPGHGQAGSGKIGEPDFLSMLLPLLPSGVPGTCTWSTHTPGGEGGWRAEGGTEGGTGCLSTGSASIRLWSTEHGAQGDTSQGPCRSGCPHLHTSCHPGGPEEASWHPGSSFIGTGAWGRGGLRPWARHLLFRSV